MFRDPDDNFTIKGNTFRGTEVVWELLTFKFFNTEVVNKG